MHIMGLLSILKKLKEKEKEMRLLILCVHFTVWKSAETALRLDVEGTHCLSAAACSRCPCLSLHRGLDNAGKTTSQCFVRL